ncbi:hypothetical protein EB118_03480 [bacterium]|nr:hypothetical protein [bacterium]NDC94041.1 hypothetical protein [bacterium]NDD82727.1 hypothetical protein [bacterium]NDG29147.1 hypothetical protein [bacterium]
MTDLKEVSVVKCEKETIMFRTFSEYIEDLFDNEAVSKKEFQKDLLDIAKWDSSTQEQELVDFLKWAKRKRGIDFLNVYNTVIDCYAILLDTTRTVELNKFFYKGLRSVARHYYENIRKWAKTGPERECIIELLRFTLQSLMPVHSVKGDFVFYEFREEQDSISDSIPTKESFPRLLVEKKSDSTDSPLEYLSSTGFLDDTPTPQKITEKRNSGDLKEIKLVKLKKGGTVRIGLVVDEINEPFFTD